MILFGNLVLFADIQWPHSRINRMVVRWYCFSIHVRYPTNGNLGCLGMVDVENIMTRQ